MKNKNEFIKKILYTVAGLIIYRIFFFIPVPFVDFEKLSGLAGYSIWNFANEFSGGSLSSLSFMSIGITSYISASIVIQLFVSAIPAFNEYVKLPGGNTEIKKYTFILSCITSFITSVGLVAGLNSSFEVLTNNNSLSYVIIALIHTCGSAVAFIISESITENGLINGGSLLIAFNICLSLPDKVESVFSLSIKNKIIIAIFVLVCFLTIMIFENCQFKIPVQYNKKYVGSQINHVKPSFFPLKVDISGVMPVILISSLSQLLGSIIQLFKIQLPEFLNVLFTTTSIPNVIITVIFIFIFTFIYSDIAVDVNDLAVCLQINEGYIKNVKPGTETIKYLKKKIFNANVLAGIYLSSLIVLSTVISAITGFSGLQVTSFIIIVGVFGEIFSTVKTELKYSKYNILDSFCYEK